MKTISKVNAWRDGATKRFGDPAVPVCQLFVTCRRAYADQLYCSLDGDASREVTLWLGPHHPLKVAIAGTKPRYVNGAVEAFGAEKIVPGVWSLHPSFNVPGLIHAFVVLYDVPEPAPWHR